MVKLQAKLQQYNSDIDQLRASHEECSVKVNAQKPREHIDQDFHNFNINLAYFEKQLNKLTEFKEKYEPVFQEIGDSRKIVDTIKNFNRNEASRPSNRFLTKEFLSKMTLHSSASSKVSKSRRFSRARNSRVGKMAGHQNKMESLMPPIPDTVKRKSYQTRERKSKLRPTAEKPELNESVSKDLPRDSIGGNSSISFSSGASRRARNSKCNNKMLVRKKSIFQTFQNELSKKGIEGNSLIEVPQDFK